MKNHNRQMNSQFITPTYVWGVADLLGYSGLFNQGDVDMK
jgi:hypothetical protein